MFSFSYKKVGGLHFVRIGRFGFSFFISKPKPVQSWPTPASFYKAASLLREREYEGGNTMAVDHER